MRARGVILVILALACLRCDQEDPGQLAFDLDTPFPEDGAVQLRVTVPAGFRLTDVAPLCDGCRVFQRVVSEQEVRAVVVGTIVDGPFVAVSVSDRRDPAVVSVTVEAAAGRDYSLRSARSDYTTLPRR